jgi:hypothetical protein
LGWDVRSHVGIGDEKQGPKVGMPRRPTLVPRQPGACSSTTNILRDRLGTSGNSAVTLPPSARRVEKIAQKRDQSIRPHLGNRNCGDRAERKRGGLKLAQHHETPDEPFPLSLALLSAPLFYAATCLLDRVDDSLTVHGKAASSAPRDYTARADTGFCRGDRSGPLRKVTRYSQPERPTFKGRLIAVDC